MHPAVFPLSLFFFSVVGDPFGLCHTGKIEVERHRVFLELQRFGRAGRVGAAWLEILSKTTAEDTHLGRVGKMCLAIFLH